MVDQGGTLFTAKSEETIMREAELLALRSISDNLANLSNEMSFHRESMASVREDMAVIKERQQQHSEFRESLRDLTKEFQRAIEKLSEQHEESKKDFERRLDVVEARNLKQDGAMGFAQWIREFGPWLLMVLGGAWAYFRVTKG